MSDIEHDCRWRLAEAYMGWCLAQGMKLLNWVAYCRALGLDVP